MFVYLIALHRVLHVRFLGLTVVITFAVSAHNSMPTLIKCCHSFCQSLHDISTYITYLKLPAYFSVNSILYSCVLSFFISFIAESFIILLILWSQPIHHQRILPLKIITFWDIVPCSIVEVDQRFRYAYCLHHQGNE
jgi:hypothetical protein